MTTGVIDACVYHDWSSPLVLGPYMSKGYRDWIARPGAARARALEQFFFWLMRVRALPFGEVWMAPDASVCAAWLPPDAPASPGGFWEQMKLMPMFVRLCGFRLVPTRLK